jgi:hypothetical protein
MGFAIRVRRVDNGGPVGLQMWSSNGVSWGNGDRKRAFGGQAAEHRAAQNARQPCTPGVAEHDADQPNRMHSVVRSDLQRVLPSPVLCRT